MKMEQNGTYRWSPPKDVDPKKWIKFLPIGIIAFVLVIGLLTCFYTNRKWVFTEADHGKGTLWHQLWLFAGSRVFTFLLDLAATYGLIHLLSLWLTPDNAPALLGVKLDAELWAKVIVSAVVIATNYYLSKLLVFKKKRT